jgi:hypothetical protein
MPWTRTRFPLLLSLLALCALVAVPAGAVDATKPAPCAGIHFTDPGGDQELASFQGFGPAESPENADIKGLFFNFKDGVLTANIQIANLTTEVPSPPTSNGGLYYYVIYDYKGAVKFVAAHNTGSAIDYEFGTIDPEVGTYTTDGDTKGAFFEGADGVVQIEVPGDVGGKAGEVLKGSVANVDGIDIGTDHANGLNNHADIAPDDTSSSAPDGKDYTVTACPAAGAPAATPAPTAAPPVTGGGGSAAPPAAADTVLPVTFGNSLGSAKKAKKGKKLTAKGKASKPISGLVVQLKKNGGKGAALASGKAATVKAGSFKVSLKLKKKLKKGVYTLIATGTVDGKKLQYGQKVGLK